MNNILPGNIAKNDKHKVASHVLGVHHIKLLIWALLYPCGWPTFCFKPWPLWYVSGQQWWYAANNWQILSFDLSVIHTYSYTIMLVNCQQLLNIHPTFEKFNAVSTHAIVSKPLLLTAWLRAMEKEKGPQVPVVNVALPANYGLPPLVITVPPPVPLLDWYPWLSMRALKQISTHFVWSIYFPMLFFNTSVRMQLWALMHSHTSLILISPEWVSRLERLLISRRPSRCGHHLRKVSQPIIICIDHCFSAVLLLMLCFVVIALDTICLLRNTLHV